LTYRATVTTYMHNHCYRQGRSQKFVLGGIKFLGWIKLLNSHSYVILSHKKFTWADFGGINTDIHPRRYAHGYRRQDVLRSVVLVG